MILWRAQLGSEAAGEYDEQHTGRTTVETASTSRMSNNTRDMSVPRQFKRANLKNSDEFLDMWTGEEHII